jgi:hypothetical protein
MIKNNKGGGEIKWRTHFGQKIVIEEYYINIRLQHSHEQYIVRYVKHNGYTTINPVAGQKTELSDWVKLNQTLYTRYDLPHWYKRIRFNRKKKLVLWGVKTIQKALNDYTQTKYATPTKSSTKLGADNDQQ